MLKEWWNEERAKLKNRTRKQQLRYIWMYYKLWIIGIVAFLWLVIFVIVRLAPAVFAQQTRPTILFLLY